MIALGTFNPANKRVKATRSRAEAAVFIAYRAGASRDWRDLRLDRSHRFANRETRGYFEYPKNSCTLLFLRFRN